MAARILVVDDDSDMRQLLAIMLSQEGWEVDAAIDGDSALKAYEARTPHLIVLDNMMPGLTGIEVAQTLRGKGSKVPIVLFSGYLNPDLMSKAEELEIWTCSKVDLRVLVRIVRNLIDQVEQE